MYICNELDLMNRYNLTKQELYYRLKYNIALDKVFICKHCGKKIKFNPKHHYQKYCSRSCSGKSTGGDIKRRLKAIETVINRYGVINYRQTKDYNIKAKLTRDKHKKEIFNKYGLSLSEYNYRIKHNIPLDKEFKCKKCGQKVVFKQYRYADYCSHKCANIDILSLESTRLKLKDAWNSRNNIEYNKVKDILNKYNLTLKEYNYRLKVNIPLDKIFVCKACGKPIKFTQKHKYKTFCNNSCSSKYMLKQPNYIKKIQTTVQEKYGVANVSQSEVIKQKKYNTMKQNGTYNKSKFEEKTYQLLLTKFGKEDIIRQYKNELYPYQCDFYIKSLDLYIEYNGHWTHGKESFDKNNLEHLNILSSWQVKSKKSKFFQTAIYVWTDLDVRKLETFKKNKLNYKIFWNIEEVEDWIRKIN